MFELLSALFLIAESNEFRLARFYHVCEEVCLVLLGSPLIVCGFVGHIRGLFKRGKDTEFDVPAGRKEILSFCFKESPHPFVFWNILSVFLLS